jgi:hypothetical protein
LTPERSGFNVEHHKRDCRETGVCGGLISLRIRAVPNPHRGAQSESAMLRLSRIAVFCLLLGLPRVLLADQGFQPVSADELSLKSEPLAPGAPAIILDHRVDRDDSVRGVAHQFNYIRIKILTEEGRKYADVEIPFLKETQKIEHINGRTIRPDGSIVNFDGKVYEKSLAKTRRFGFMAKTFTLSDIEVGSIIEYFYMEDFQYVFDSHWIVSEELFTKSAHYSLKPFHGNGFYNVGLRWTWKDLPQGVAPKQGPDGIVRMDVSNIPAFEKEDHEPPENELKARVDFAYENEAAGPDADKFWQSVGKKWNDYLERFVDKRKAMEQAVGQIVAPNDPPEVKLRKLYDRVQEIRNKSYEISKTEQEEKREKEKADLNVEDVWKRGYGDGQQLTWLYLGLVRAAGFDAYGCMVSSRREYFFVPKSMEPGKLNSNVVLVKFNGKDLYLDPGAEFTPFGMLTWSETGVHGLCLDKNGGNWVITTLPESSESRIGRVAKLKLSESGDLEGKLTITYTGLEAMYHRLDIRHADDLARKKFLETAAVDQIPVAGEAELTNKPDWTSSETPLVAEFNLKIPGWASNAGKRVMVAAAVFTAHEKNIFEHANRVHPIYFDYPYEKLDDVTIELPPGWQVASVPPVKTQDSHIVAYDLKVEDGKTSLHLSRKLDIDFFYLEQKYYTALRSFFQLVRTADEEQVVLQPGTATATN